MRLELVGSIEELADPKLQLESWVIHRTSAFDFTVHFLFDDTALATDPESSIGYFLVDAEEALAVNKVCKAIDEIFDEYGTDLSDATYIALPEWKQVVAAATEAKKIIWKNAEFVEYSHEDD